MTEDYRLIIIALVGSIPAVITAGTAAYLAWKSSQASKAASDQSTKNAHSIEQVRSATSLNTDRTGTMTFSINDLQRKLDELGKR